MNRLLTVRLLMGWSLVMVVTFGVPAGAQGSPPPGPSGLEDAAASSCAAPATHGFNDVPTNHFANLAVGWLVGAGITSGTSPGTYSPSQPVTRAQMAVFLWRAAGGPTRWGRTGSTTFPPDISPERRSGGWSEPASPPALHPARTRRRNRSPAHRWRCSCGEQPVGPPGGGRGFNDVPPDTSPERRSGGSSATGSPPALHPADTPPSNMVTRAQMAVFLWRSSCPPPPVDFTMLTITDDGSYSMDESNGVVKVTNGQVGRGANTRVVVAKRGSPPDSVCATIESVTGAIVGFAQPGVAVHIRTAGGRTTALTLTNNVWATARWIWNAHHMDSGSSEGFTGLGSFEAPGFYREGQPLPPLPWRVCARTVGNTVQGKVWNAGAVEPAWGDPNFGGSVSIPRGLATGGESGVYAGHLQAGQGFRFSNVGPAAVAVRG
ncbi:MAG: S-layer homology domain-containing protein [Candidatus Microthrix sp.]|nr:S-layer homology domain-containing protein [Candidatus Microthrix sp.]